MGQKRRGGRINIWSDFSSFKKKSSPQSKDKTFFIEQIKSLRTTLPIELKFKDHIEQIKNLKIILDIESYSYTICVIIPFERNDTKL